MGSVNKPGKGGDGMYVGFTQRARRAIAAAADEAARMHVGYVGVEHLLLGLLRERRDAAVKVLGARGIDLERARAEVGRRAADLDGATIGSPGLTPAAKHAIEIAVAEAREWSAVAGGRDRPSGAVGTAHLLIGVMRAAEGVSAEVLRALGIEPGTMAALMQREVGGAATSSSDMRADLQAASCPSCGRPMRAGWKHCIYCGATVRDGCPRCGAPLQHVPGEAYCHECGAQLRPATDAPTVPLEGDEPTGQG